MGDHTETVQIDYDPQVLSYARLLTIFWNKHRPGRRSWTRQYMNAVFYHNDTQKELALQSKAVIEQKSGRIVRTKILPLRAFYRAEGYHQKYVLNRRPELVKEMTRIYPNEKDYVNSKAVARLNGYVGGHGTMEQLKREIDQLGLGPKGQRVLIKLVRGFW